MSITRTLLRLLCAEAIKGKTLAGSNVFDSNIDPIAVAVAETNIPVVLVYTDDDQIEVTGRDIRGGTRTLELVIEIAVASEITDGAITIPKTDFGLEWSIDIMEHQIDVALLGGQTEWSQAFMKLVPAIKQKASRRGGSSLQGVRYAARQIILTLEPISDPDFGRPVNNALPFGAALVMIEANADTKDIGGLIRTTLEGGAVTELQATIARIGMSRDGAIAMGLEEISLVPMPEIEITESDTGETTTIEAP